MLAEITNFLSRHLQCRLRLLCRVNGEICRNLHEMLKKFEENSDVDIVLIYYRNMGDISQLSLNDLTVF